MYIMIAIVYAYTHPTKTYTQAAVVVAVNMTVKKIKTQYIKIKNY